MKNLDQEKLTYAGTKACLLVKILSNSSSKKCGKFRIFHMDWGPHPRKPFWWMGLPSFWKPSLQTFWPQIQNLALIPLGGLSLGLWETHPPKWYRRISLLSIYGKRLIFPACFLFKITQIFEQKAWISTP